MLLAYVDESFKAAFYGFAGVVADEHAVKALIRRMDEIVLSLGEEFAVPPRSEVHAHPVFHGKDEWAPLPPRLRVWVFDQVVDAVRASGARVVMRGVDADQLRRRQQVARYPENHPPEQVAFQHLLQRIDMIASQRGTYALVIADERDDRDRHRELIVSYQTGGTPGTYLQTRLDRLLDTVHFAPSHHSRMLQVADVIAFLWTRSQTVRESDDRKQRAIERMMEQLHRSAFQPGVWPRA